MCGKNHPALWHVSNPFGNTLKALVGGNVVAVNRDGTTFGWQQAHQAFKEGCFAHTIATHDRNGLFGIGFYRNTVQRFALTVGNE